MTDRERNGRMGISVWCVNPMAAKGHLWPAERKTETLAAVRSLPTYDQTRISSTDARS